MVFHVDILMYNSVLKEVQDKTGQIMNLIDNIGELDALISIASFRRILPEWCNRSLYSGKKRIINQYAWKQKLSIIR